MAFVIAISKITRVPRAYNVPNVIDLALVEGDLEPFVVSSSSMIVDNLMEHNTKKQIISACDEVGLKVKRKSDKIDLASQLASKLVEGLIPEEKNDDKDKKDKKSPPKNEVVAKVLSALLAFSLEGDKEDFFDFVEKQAEVIKTDDGNEVWSKDNEMALQMLQMDGVFENLTNKHLELLDNLMERKSKVLPLETDIKTVLNSLGGGDMVLRLKVVGADNIFQFGYNSSTKFGELFSILQSKGIDVSSPQDNPCFVLKTGAGGSTAMSHEIISDWVGNKGGEMLLTPLMRGGGKQVKKDKAVKVASFKADMSSRAQSINRAVFDNIPHIADVEKRMGQLMDDIEKGNCEKLIGDCLEVLSFQELDLLSNEFEKSQGSADSRLLKVAPMLLGGGVKRLADLNGTLTNVVCMSQTLVLMAFNKAMSENKDYSLKSFRRKLEQEKFKKLGAETQSMNDL